jgi:hypothetical protein
MSSNSPGRRSISDALRSSSMPSTTRAIEARKIGVPIRYVTISRPNESTPLSFPATRTSGSRPFCSSLPAGISRFSRWSARVTSAYVSPYDLSRSRSRKIWISRRVAPTRFACPTPGTVSIRFLMIFSASEDRVFRSAEGLSIAMETIGMVLKSIR